jgi:uncharacterized membrane protein (DUF485 family)
MSHHDRSQSRSIAEEPAFRRLVRAKRRSAVPALVVGVGFYMAISLMAGYAPSFMSASVSGAVNVGYVLIVATYVLTWAIAVIYVRRANRTFDRLASAAVGAGGVGGDEAETVALGAARGGSATATTVGAISEAKA